MRQRPKKKAGLGGIGSQLGGLASLAGVNLSSMGAVDKTDLALELLKSKQFIGEFIAANNMLIPLMAAKSYDLTSKQFVIDDEIYDVHKKVWVRESVLPRLPEPTMNEAADVFGELMDVSKEKTTGIVRLSLEHMSPELVQQWTTELVKALNNEIRRRDIAEAEQSLKYLEVKLREANITEVRDSIAQLIEERTKTLMMANIRDEYVLTVVDPAFLPDEKFKPRRSAIVLMSMFAVGLLLMMIGYFRIVFRLKSTGNGFEHV